PVQTSRGRGARRKRLSIAGIGTEWDNGVRAPRLLSWKPWPRPTRRRGRCATDRRGPDLTLPDQTDQRPAEEACPRRPAEGPDPVAGRQQSDPGSLWLALQRLVQRHLHKRGAGPDQPEQGQPGPGPRSRQLLWPPAEGTHSGDQLEDHRWTDHPARPPLVASLAGRKLRERH